MAKSLVKNSIYNIVYKLVTAIYPLVAVTYVSHILMSENMGIVSYAQNIV
jgi:O-antigen/teichoic acid export membrane protein